MIVDKVKIKIKAGNGGDGAVSFHREKYVNAGGPDGGDGGNGGDVIFMADHNMRTLMDFRLHRAFRAGNGEPGRKKNMRGANGKNIVVKVPVGTVIYDADTGKVAADIGENVTCALLRGGKGGKGNARFANAVRKTPRFSTPGKKVHERTVILELKSIADVGLAGFPNVGKSTLLSVITSARPKIDNYHFTTLSPNLGVVDTGDADFIVADIPGLIEGAADGAGLGHDFLRHIERTRMIAHVIDMSGSEGRDPVEDYEVIRHELEEYAEQLADLPELIIANKMDLPQSGENLARFTDRYPDRKILAVSAATREGTDAVKYEMAQMLRDIPESAPIAEQGVVEQWANEDVRMTCEVNRAEDGILTVSGSLVDDILHRTNPDEPDSMRHFHKLLKDLGIVKMLLQAGAKDGDTVRLGDEEFEFVE